MLTDIRRVTTISDSVGSSRCSIRVMTGMPVNMEVPRSPCRINQDHSPKRARKGRSRPRLLRIFSTSSGDACSPAITAAGSPGAI
jgi:hypothetical protein